MKELKKEVTRYETYYEADDGTQFINKADCESYEKSKQGLMMRFLKSKAIKVVAGDLAQDSTGLNTFYYEADAYLFKPADIEDASKIMTSITEAGYGVSGVKSEKDFLDRANGDNVFLFVIGDYGAEYFGTIDDYKSQVCKYIDDCFKIIDEPKGDTDGKN